MSQNGNLSGNNSAYLLDSDTIILYSRGDWGFGLKIPIRILGLWVNLPVIPGRIIGSKKQTFHEIRRLKEWLHDVSFVEIVMPKDKGKWHVPRFLRFSQGCCFFLGLFFL